MATLLDLENLPISDKIDFLQERMACAPVPLELDPHPGADVVVRSRVAELGRVHQLSTNGSGADVIRSERLVRDSNAAPKLLLTVIENGASVVVHRDQTMTLRAGDMGICLTDTAYRLRFGNCTHRHTFHIELDDLGLPEDLIRSQLHRPMTSTQATTAAVSAFLRATARRAPGASQLERTSLEQPIIDLIRLQLTRVVSDTKIGKAAATASLATRVEEHVRSHVDDPDLSARTVADAFAISERYVYKILAQRGIDLGELIRTQRLDAALRMLEDPGCDSMTVSAIAYRSGFADHAHFSRTFRARFGTTPTDWRRQSRQSE